MKPPNLDAIFRFVGKTEESAHGEVLEVCVDVFTLDAGAGVWEHSAVAVQTAC